MPRPKQETVEKALDRIARAYRSELEAYARKMLDTHIAPYLTKHGLDLTTGLGGWTIMRGRNVVASDFDPGEALTNAALGEIAAILNAYVEEAGDLLGAIMPSYYSTPLSPKGGRAKKKTK